MNLRLVIFPILFFLVSCESSVNQVAGSDSPKNTNLVIKQTSPSPSNFHDYKIFEIANSNNKVKSQECQSICEKTCGGECVEINEAIRRTLKENPKFKPPKIFCNGCPLFEPKMKIKISYWVIPSSQTMEGDSLPEKTTCAFACN